VSAFFGIGALIVFLPVVFQEFDVQVSKLFPERKRNAFQIIAIFLLQERIRVATEEKNPVNSDEMPETQAASLPKPDYLVLVVLLFCFWLFFINFVILET
jgi:hypothetical protein